MRLFITFLMMVFTLTLFAQKAKRVCGEYTYYAEGNETANQAKQKALEGAKLQALAAEFGTIVSQNTMMQNKSTNEHEKNYFSELSSSEVKGEWLEDLGEPEYKINYIDNVLVVYCKICGKARELSNDAAEFEATVLKNGQEDRFASTKFREGDYLYVKFQAAQDGYVAIYLIDETPEAFCLLPYTSDTDANLPVTHGKEYIFFSPNHKTTPSESVDELYITCQGEVEQNQLYIIFSPNQFSKAVDKQMNENLPRQLSLDKFNEWLSRCRKRDTKMGVKVVHLEISKK